MHYAAHCPLFQSQNIFLALGLFIGRLRGVFMLPNSIPCFASRSVQEEGEEMYLRQERKTL